MAIYGVDQYAYPGELPMAWLYNQGFRITGFYLGPTAGGEHPNSSWMNTRASLSLAKWGFLPTYVGRQINDANLDAVTGASDANDAIGLMTEAGFPQNSFVYLDIENGTVSASFATYIEAWITQVSASNYNPGLYCSHDLLPTYASRVDRIWSWDIPANTNGQTYDPAALPSAAVDNLATATQFRQKVFLTGYGNTQVDLTDCSIADPSF